MKRALSLLGLGLTLLACFHMETEQKLEQAISEEICFTAYANEVETKNERQSDGSVFWNPGDAVSLFFNQGDHGGNRFVAQNTEVSAIAEFRGTITGFAGGGESTGGEFWFWGVYPYSEDNSCDGSSVTITLPAQQTAKAGTFANGLFPTMAKSQGLSLRFYNICGGFKFTVSRDDIKAVKFRGNANEDIAGKAKVVWDSNGHPAVSEHLVGYKEVTVTAPNNGTFVPGIEYYIVFYPELLSGGFTLTFITSASKQGSFSYSSSRQLKRGIFVNGPNLDTYVTTWTDAEGETPGSEDLEEGGTESGLYFGLSTFDRNYRYYSVQLISESSLDSYKSTIDGLQLTNLNGTLLFYSCDEDITSMQGLTLPSDLTTVSLVTFTDGFDEGSTNKHLDLYDSDDEYLDYVTNRMLNETVKGIPIKSYAIGLKGTDANSDIVSFRNCLRALASSPSNQYVYEIDANEFNKLRDAFTSIAEDLSESIKLFDISVHFTLPSDEQKIRITFDIANPLTVNASSSNLYIEGIYSRKDWCLHDITYHGFSSNSGDSIQITKYDGMEVHFDFKGLQLLSSEEQDIIDSCILTWKYNANTSTWRANTESDSGGEPVVKVVKSSALVLLNLDLSRSLEGRLADLKTYSKEFISTLYTSSVDPNVVKTVRLNKTEMSLLAGKTEALVATVSPSTANIASLKWESAIPSVATVDQNGNVTGVSEGTTIITVSSEDGKAKATCTVRVVFQHIQSISLNATELSLFVGKTSSLVVNTLPEDASNPSVTWHSSNPSVVSVNNDGLVTALSLGSAIITATSTDGEKTASCSVTVTDYTPSSEPIDLSLAVWCVPNSGSAYRGYIPYDDLDYVNISDYNIIGLTVLSSNGGFIMALEDASTEEMYHEASSFYNMPSKAQGITISARWNEINTALQRFNGDPMKRGIWTSASDGTDATGRYYYYFYIDGSGGSLASSGSYVSGNSDQYVREVIPIDNATPNCFITKSKGIYYSYMSNSQRCFVVSPNQVPSGCSIDGIAIGCSKGVGGVIIALKDASSSAMTWTSASSTFGRTNLPSKLQALLISARLKEVNDALANCGGDKLVEYTSNTGWKYYWTSDSYYYNSKTLYYYLDAGGCQLNGDYADDTHFVRLVKGSF